MDKTFERRVATSASSNSRLRYRRKVSMPTEKEQEPTEDEAQHVKLPFTVKHREQLKPELPFDSRSKSGCPKQQPVVLKQLLWKAKAVQSTPTLALSLTTPKSKDNEDDKVDVVKEKYQKPKLLKSGGDAKRKRIDGRGHESESFVAGSSSQETQSGSEDDVVFLRYSDLQSAVQPSTKWPMDKTEQKEIDREEPASSEEVVKRQVGVEKTTASRRNQRQQYRWKEKQKRAAAKRHKRLQHQQKQEHEWLHPTDDNTGSTQERESATLDSFHPSTNLMSGMDAGICRAVYSQVEKLVPFIVIGDVACPVAADSEEQFVGAASTSYQSEASTTGSEVAIVDFRQDVSAMLNQSKEMQVQYRDSFVVEKSGFDAASSYDFFKHRFSKIQKTAAIVYY